MRILKLRVTVEKWKLANASKRISQTHLHAYNKCQHGIFPPLDRIDAKDTRNTQCKHSYIEYIIHLMETRTDVFVCMKPNIYVDFPIRFSFIRRKLNAIRVLCFICFRHLINFLFGWWLLLVGSCHIKLGVDSMCIFVNTFHCHRKPNTVQMFVRHFPRRHHQKTEAAREVITNLLF